MSLRLLGTHTVWLGSTQNGAVRVALHLLNSPISIAPNVGRYPLLSEHNHQSKNRVEPVHRLSALQQQFVRRLHQR